jgi:predicted permease
VSQAATRERRRHLTGRLVLIGQLALCAVLLIGAGSMLRSVENLRSQSLGFDRNVLLVTIGGGRGEAGALPLGRVREQLRAIRGVSAVSTTGSPLLDTRAYWIDGSERLAVDGREPVTGIRWTFADVGAGFFETIGMPLVQGRGIDDADFNPPSDAVVINQTLATLLFGSRNPIGSRIGMTASSPRLRIVGVVNDARQTSPRDRGLGVVYRPLHQFPPQVVLAVRTIGPPASFADVVQHQLKGIDGLDVIAVRTVEGLLNDAIAQERLLGTLAAWLGVLVIVVACVGLHALISNDVAQRTHEMGVRLALGATRASVALLVLRDCLALVGLGLAIGVPLSVAATRPLSSQLYGLPSGDPQTVAAVVVLLVAVALIAAGRPAQSAARVDPVVLLRAD